MNEGLEHRTLRQSANEIGVSDQSLRNLGKMLRKAEKEFWAKRGIKVKDLNKQDSMRTRITREARSALAEIEWEEP